MDSDNDQASAKVNKPSPPEDHAPHPKGDLVTGDLVTRGSAAGNSVTGASGTSEAAEDHGPHLKGDLVTSGAAEDHGLHLKGASGTGTSEAAEDHAPHLKGDLVTGGSATSGAAEYWATNLDPQNLERAGDAETTLSIEDEIAFAATPDAADALDYLLAAPAQPGPGAPGQSRNPPAGPGRVIDVGAGLGAVSFFFARRGASVVSVDTSLDRLRLLRRRAREAGCADGIVAVVAQAEALPFRSGSVPAVFSKSVLIHTDLSRALPEIERVLAPGGRAAIDEPGPGNPFAWVYRHTLGPKVWRSITRYFDGEAQRACFEAIGPGRVRPYYLFSFLAFAFQFGLPNVRLFRASLAVLHAVDRALFAVLPFLRPLAWFGLIEIEKARGGEKNKQG